VGPFRRFTRGKDQATPAKALGSVATVILAVVAVLAVVFFLIQSLA